MVYIFNCCNLKKSVLWLKCTPEYTFLFCEKSINLYFNYCNHLVCVTNYCDVKKSVLWLRRSVLWLKCAPEERRHFNEKSINLYFNYCNHLVCVTNCCNVKIQWLNQGEVYILHQKFWRTLKFFRTFHCIFTNCC